MAKQHRNRAWWNYSTDLAPVADRTSAPSELESNTVQGQNTPLRVAYNRAVNGLHVNGRNRSVFQNEEGEVDFADIPEINSRVDRLTAMSDRKERIEAEIEYLTEEMEAEKKRLLKEELKIKNPKSNESTANGGRNEVNDDSEDAEVVD